MFLYKNIYKKKSGLLYLCGSPGTGKSSSLNQALNHFTSKPKTGQGIELFTFNAMTFTSFRQFLINLLQDLKGTTKKRDTKRFKQDLDSELCTQITKAIQRRKAHKIIVIEEIDCFE